MRWHLQFPAGFLLHDSPNKAAGQDAAIADNDIIFIILPYKMGFVFILLYSGKFSVYI